MTIHYNDNMSFNTSIKIYLTQYTKVSQQQNQQQMLSPIQIPQPLLQHAGIKEQIQAHIEFQEQLLKSRLHRNHQLTQKIQDKQKQFQQWANAKSQQYRTKIQQSAKLKQEQIKKIKQKCKSYLSGVNQKHKSVLRSRKAYAEEAWTNSTHLNQKLDLYRTKQSRLNKTMQAQRKALMSSQNIQHEESLVKDKLSTPILRSSLLYSTVLKPKPQYDEHKARQFDAYKRYKEAMRVNHEEAVQNLGERLERIEISRNKKKEQLLPKKKDQPEETQRETDTSNNKLRREKSQRSPTKNQVKEKRTQNWTNVVKLRQSELHQSKVMKDDAYLEKEKIRFMKNSLAKNIAQSAIERKLFLERITE